MIGGFSLNKREKERSFIWIVGVWQNTNLHFRDDVSGLKLRRDRDLNRIFESQKFRMIVVHVFDVHNHLELVFGFQIKVI